MSEASPRASLTPAAIADLQRILRRLPSYKDQRRRTARAAIIASLQQRLPKILPTVWATAYAAGYAVTLHGSISRDVDLVLLPWAPQASETPLPTLITRIITAIQAQNAGYAELRDRQWINDPSYLDAGSPGSKPHGRLGWCIYIDPDPDLQIYLDISAFPPYPTHDPYGDIVAKAE